ncbi:hypothetical protein [Pseudonocardia broussonetiae]|uniref:Uncharacterized protein n=1 Tax=Pseudonocardia broussonetiae TaxID=2736640 RepID=A0A6M6JIU5_9PSEU|nr:hypothetical protein [Pseudonocardia broussonetiae]QJY47958.1 hypothetical protein HOP40_20930 [Pseudonocardia broussonetiae]
MTTGFPRSPKTLSGGIVLVDPATSAVRRIVVLQYNPDTLSRTLQVQGSGAESGDRVDVLRLKGAPVQTIKLDAELDAGDQLEQPDAHPQAVQLGIAPQIAALEACVYPASATVLANEALAASGSLEILPAEAALTLFVWGARRILPVRVAELSVTEEAFDPALNPIRAKVTLGLRVLGTNDVPRGHRAAALFMAHHQSIERLAASTSGQLAALGIGRLP